jgi:hypothetical protein
MVRTAAPAEIEIGYGVDAGGRGIAYARSENNVLRTSFRISHRASSMEHRAAGYAALATVARSIAKGGMRRVRFHLPDQQLVEELGRRSEPPEQLALANVRVRCALNALEYCEIEFKTFDDLMQRARAEVALNLAA